MCIYIAYLYLHIIFGKYEISLKRLIFIFIYRDVYISTCVLHTGQRIATDVLNFELYIFVSH